MVINAGSRTEGQVLPEGKLAYRVPEACAVTGYGKTTMWKLICAGKIKAKKDGRLTIILRADLQEYLQSLPNWHSARRSG